MGDCTKVAFTAVVDNGGDYGPFDCEKTVVYNKVITNIGCTYNNCTGIFTAPVAGVYHFSFFYHAGGQYETGLWLMKNCDLIVKTSDHKKGITGNGGNAALVQLQKGDQVFVRMSAYRHVWADDHHTSFSGYLVSQM